MQVIPRSWIGSATQLADPAYNIFRGMFILNSALEQADGDMLMALALYNCGERAWDQSWNGMACGTSGGLFYAHKVLFYYCPYFDDTGEACAHNTDGVRLQRALDALHVLEATSGRNWRVARSARPGVIIPLSGIIE
jgi:hypothetical protein